MCHPLCIYQTSSRPGMQILAGFSSDLSHSNRSIIHAELRAFYKHLKFSSKQNIPVLRVGSRLKKISPTEPNRTRSRKKPVDWKVRRAQNNPNIVFHVRAHLSIRFSGDPLGCRILFGKSTSQIIPPDLKGEEGELLFYFHFFSLCFPSLLLLLLLEIVLTKPGRHYRTRLLVEKQLFMDGKCVS